MPDRSTLNAAAPTIRPDPEETTTAVQPDPSPDCSIVLVTYQSAADLPACLASLPDAAGGRALELVVVDNASTDGSADLARELAERHGLSVKVIANTANTGYARAANQGAAQTTGSWILVANPDTRFEPGAVERLLTTASVDPSTGCIGPRLLDPTDGGDYPTGRRFPSLLDGLLHAVLAPVWPGNPATRRYHLADLDRTRPARVDWVSGAAIMLRRDVWDTVGGFDEGYFMYAEDMDLCMQVARTGHQVVLDPGATVWHAVGGSTRSRPYRKVVDHHRSTLRFYVRRHRRNWRVLLAPLVALFLLVRGLASVARVALTRRA